MQLLNASLWRALYLTIALVAATNAHAGTLTEVIRSAFAGTRTSTIPAAGTIEVAFSPNGGAQAAVLRLIQEAKTSIRMSAYGLTANRIGAALADAKRRGVDVKIVVDREHNGRRGETANSVVAFLVGSGIPVRIDTAVKIQHNKVLIVDGKSVQTGSANFTAAADKANAENILIIRDNSELAAIYTANWESLWNESIPFRSRY